MTASIEHQRDFIQEMHRHLLHTSKTALNNDKSEISDFRSMSESRVKSCNNYASSSSNGVSPQSDLQFSRISSSEEKNTINLHTCIVTTRPEFSSASCHCTLDRQNECFVDDRENVPSVSNNHKGEYQNSKNRLTTSELLSHNRPAKEGRCDGTFQQSICANVNSLWRFHTWRVLLIICIAILCTACNADISKCATGIQTPGSKYI